MASPSPGRQDKGPDRVQVIAQNRRAKFDYTIEEKVEAGLSLTGAEVKDLRDGQANLGDAYGLPKNGELFLLNARFGNTARHAGAFAPEPTRTRKLLLHRQEIDRWTSKVRERGYSIIPLVLYFKNGRAKVELALCKGKTHEDRRSDIKQRETKREMDRAMRRR